MKMKNLVGDRYKERPADCVIDSHAMMIKGGYIKYMANGIYSLYTPGKRIVQKIEAIIRSEMDAIGGQEVMLPIVMPGSLWQESGRFDSVGDELLRFTDRNSSSLVLGMTHEEAAVHLVREYAGSYLKYPFMIYQIQTKFRDEARPRGGLLRVREFVMKDAYSFHTSVDDLEEFYGKCYAAYEKIFDRVGLTEVIAVEADSGMMGGRISHEFMMLTPIGEDSIAICESCGYKSNMEAAESIIEKASEKKGVKALDKVKTPDCTTIKDVSEMLGVPSTDFCKAVVYQKNSTDEFIVIFIRGDLEVNETKITNFLGEKIHPAKIDDLSGLVAGYIGPLGLKDEVKVLYDQSLKNRESLVCGANEKEFHFVGLNLLRDCGDVEFGDYSKIFDGAICPCCGKRSIKIKRGVEVGNIFQLGTKYTSAMNMHYVDNDGNRHLPIMGCYGIGIGRLMASVCEAYHDEHGPIWPISIAPWQVHICCLRSDNAEARIISDKLYGELRSKNVEVIYDDRDVRAGVMFSEADLLGVPIRAIVSPRNLKEGIIEVVTRDKKISTRIGIAEAADYILGLMKKQMEPFEYDYGQEHIRRV